MWIARVDCPDELVAAQENRNLVIFAGAGVSVDPPSTMPSYEALIREIANRAGETLPEGKIEEPDVVLANLQQIEGFDVHQQAHDLLSRDPEPEPNHYHADIAALFPESNAVRIVTTNHERLFEHAFDARFGPGQVPSYSAPALPLAAEYSGICHIHGALGGDPEHLVLTEDDFGRAYLTEGWATSFLRNLYSQYAVLFIGYSHSESLLKYLARGLATTTSRFMLVREGDPLIAQLRQLRIKPVVYPDTPGEPFAELGQFLERWAVRSAMGHLEHRARLEGLLLAPPPIDPDDQDYVRESLTIPARAEELARIAPHPDWLEWATEDGVLTPLFGVKDQLTETENWIARWVAENFVTQRPGRLQDIFRHFGSVLAPETWGAFIRRLLYADPSPPPETLGRWVDLLVAQVPPRAYEMLGHLARNLAWDEHRPSLQILFAELTSPVALVSPDLMGGDPSISVTTKGDAYSIKEVWDRHLEPHIDEIAAWLEDLVTTQIEMADMLLEAAGEETTDYDFMSFRVPEI